MDELKLLITQMKKGMDANFLSMESRLSHMEEKITSKVNAHMTEKFEGLNRDLQDLRLRIDNQEKRLYHLEKTSVERNLVFHGVCENEKSYADLQNKILTITSQKLGVHIQESEIQSLKRLGKKEGKPRPVSVVFTTLGTKINILKHKKHLTGSDIYITHEFPPSILQKRRELKVELKKEIEKGNNAFIKYDKLVVKQKSSDNNNKKRHLSVSPTQTGPSTTQQNIDDSNRAQSNWKNSQSAKKHRTSKNTMLAYVGQNTET